jgi:hypothetical protein
MKRYALSLVAAVVLGLSVASAASAAPTNPPQNPNACVGRSSTTANAMFQDLDPDKFRSEQARGETFLGVPAGERGRRDDVNAIFANCEG